MKSAILALFLAGPAAAGLGNFGNSVTIDVADINNQPITPATVSASTITASLSGANSSALFPYSPLFVFGNANTYLQFVLQNLSNGTNASGDFIIANDLAGDTSYYLDIGVNSSKFSQTGQSAEASSSTFVASSDSDLLLWSGTNGGLNGAANERIIFGSSNPVTANIAAVLQPATASGPGAFTMFSSATFKATGTGTNPAATFSPNLSSTTASGALSGTFTNATLTTCVSTRTLTLPTNVQTVLVTFSGTVSVNSLAAVIGAGVLVDGAYTLNETSAKGLVAPLEPVSTDGTNMSFSRVITGLSAATHNFCLSLFVSAGTGTIDSTNSAMGWDVTMLP